MPTRLAKFFLLLSASLLLVGCEAKEKATPTTTVAAPPPAAGTTPPAVESVAATPTTDTGHSHNTTPTTGNTGGTTTPIGEPTATVAPEGGLASYATAPAIVQPDHFAVLKLDMATLRNSAFLKSLPVNPEQMAGSIRVPGAPGPEGAAEMAKKLEQVETLWVSLGPPRGVDAMPFSLAIYAHCASPQAATETLAAMQADPAKADRFEHQGGAYFKSKQPGGPIWAVKESDVYMSSDENVVRNAIAAGGKISDAEVLKKLAGAKLDAPLVLAGSFGPFKESISQMAVEALKNTPLSPELGKIPTQIDWGVVAINPDAEAIVDIDADMQSPASAENLKLSINGLVSMAKLLLQRQQAAAAQVGDRDPAADASFGLLHAALSAVKVEQADRHVDAAFNRFAELAKLPEMMTAQIEHARAIQYINNAKMLGLAAHNHHDATRNWPADIKSADGKPLLSWRYQVLPYLEETILYQQMRRDEAWDSPANEQFSQKLPAIFASPSATEPNLTTWRMLQDHPSGIMFLDAGKGTDMTWSRPDGFRVDADDPEANLGEEPAGGHIVVNRDGSVEQLSRAALVAKLSGKPAGETPAVGDPTAEPPAADGPLAAQEPRFWQPSTGRTKIKAVLVGVKDGKVTLKRSDTNREFSVPLEKLSQPDQEYIRSLNLPN